MRLKARLAVIVLVAALLATSVYLLVGSSQSCACGSGTVSILSGSLQSGVTASNSTSATARFDFTINNPGMTYYITSITLTGGNLSSPITQWSVNQEANSSVNFAPPYSPTGANELGGGSIKSFSFYLVSTGGPQKIIFGQTYDFIFKFTNGESRSSSIVAN